MLLPVPARGLGAGIGSIALMLEPRLVEQRWAVVLASLLGFAGNGAVAVFRIRVGRQIGGAALVADGQHARVDGWTSLAVLIGALGVGAGYPLADPLAGAAISIAILVLVWQAARAILPRILAGAETGILDRILHAPSPVPAAEAA